MSGVFRRLSATLVGVALVAAGVTAVYSPAYAEETGDESSTPAASSSPATATPTASPADQGENAGNSQANVDAAINAVVQRIQQIDAEAASLAQQYSQSEIALEQARASQTELSAAILVQENRISQLQIGIAQLVNTQRQDPGFGAALNFVVAESPQDFISSMATMDSVESILEEQAARYQSEQARMADLHDQLAAQVNAIETQVELQRELIAQQEARAAQARAALKSLNESQLARFSSDVGESQGVLPFAMPTRGILTSPFGWRDSPTPEIHEGNDYGAACGTPIIAAADGKVITAGWSPWFGWYVEIDHGRVGSDYFRTGYAHMTDYVVASGDQVLRGQIIGFVGNTGESYGCHLHFIVKVNGRYVDGRYYL